ncbi:hypothetical protein KIPB_009024 [Kipferlia bialata]|uniref:Uncharacterized protein n=1 Tax=Kipferlia bialata TaxID=797122 RepID=A0A391NNY1_9EUKA|nr:hypothetical protein KIPB_009024 [Kipferlia bialata]|eukprot:g9024.t1
MTLLSTVALTAMPDDVSPWDRCKSVLAKVGIVGASVAIPAAIAVATGGIGIPAVAALLPISKTVTDTLGKLGVDIPIEGLATTLAGCLGGKGGDAVKAVFGLVTGKKKEAKREIQIKASIEQVLRPHMRDISEVCAVTSKPLGPESVVSV